ncbi:tyrosine-type recombinase/integrase [Parasphingorhabdus sp. DH2-15]|uniref:tyrosine-type recombinase/integrase n=1 Tax=Parasphingorhabdus sp. DH2-15 TaxID=3444112 RepID=UPI003F686890
MPLDEMTDWSVFNALGQRKYLSERERRAVLEYADTLTTKKRVLIYLLLYTGCRISEALNFSKLHLDADQNVVVLMTLKRRKQHFRCLPIPEFLTQMLLELEYEEDGRFWTIHRVTAWRWVKDAMAACQIRGPMATCKGLRHGFGIWAATQSVPQNIIQRWMGHAQPGTTAIYLNVVGKEERRFARRMWEPKYPELRLAA